MMRLQLCPLSVSLFLWLAFTSSIAVGNHPEWGVIPALPSNLLVRGGENPLGRTDAYKDCPEILQDTVMYEGWRTIIQRKVRMRNGKIVDFDLVGTKTSGSAVLIFAWDTKSKTATLLREYMPASHKILWGLSAGLVEDKHQNDVATAARDELEEEAQLTGGTWIPLSKGPAAMDKYAITSIHAYLVLDPVHADNPKPLDDEEDIEVVSGITIPEIMEWISSGEMNLVSGWGCMLAINKLRELGEYPPQ